MLEDRFAPATLTVETLANADSGGLLSLRGAILDSINHTSTDSAVTGTGNDTIVFDPALFTSGPQTITLTSQDATATGIVGPTALGITGSTTITVQGPTSGNGLTITQSGAGRLFYVAPAGNLTIQSLTLTGGVTQGGSGGNGSPGSSSVGGGGGGGGGGFGGAVFNEGNLTLEASTLAGNQAVGGKGGNAGQGVGGGNPDAAGVGGGLNPGAPGLFISNINGSSGGFGGGGGGGAGKGISPQIHPSPSFATAFGGGYGQQTFDFSAGHVNPYGGIGGTGGFGGGAGGSVWQGGGGGAGLGGGIFNNGGTVFISNSTLANNIAQGGDTGTSWTTATGSGRPGQGDGGAVFNRSGTLTVVNSTLASNVAQNGKDGAQSPGGAGAGGGIYNLGDSAFGGGHATVTLTNTILAESMAPLSGTAPTDFDGSGSASGSNNLIQNNHGFTGTGTITGQDPLLTALGSFGGPTQTMMPQNPIVIAGSDTTQAPYNLTTDQRGQPRKSGFVVDIGAFQVPARAVYYEVTGAATAFTDAAGSVITTGHAGTQLDPYLATTLRAAVTAAANDFGGPDTITFDPALFMTSAGTITLSAANGTPDGTAGPSDFGIFGVLTIVGPGGDHGLTLLNTGGQRLFYVGTSGSLTLENLTLSGGMAQGGSSDHGCGGAGMGGAIFNQGSLTLIRSTLSGNTAHGGAGGDGSGSYVGASVSITINGVQQSATLQSDGSFSTSFDTHALGVTVNGYAIAFSYAGDSDYGSATGSSTLTVNKKALTAQGTLSGGGKIYDGTTSASPTGAAALQTAESTGSGSSSDGAPYTGDDVSLTGIASYSFNSKDVATANTITVSSLFLTGAQAGDYTLTAPTLSATITAKALTAQGTLSGGGKTYDGTTSASPTGAAALQTAESTGAGTTADDTPYSSDTVNLMGTAVYNFNSKDVATATAITLSGLSLAGAQAGDYTLTAPTLSATITAKALPYTGLSVPTSKVYDGTTTAVASGAAALHSTEGTGTGTTADGKPYSVDSVSLTGTPTGTYNSKDVATATTVTFGGLTLTGTSNIAVNLVNLGKVANGRTEYLRPFIVP